MSTIEFNQRKFIKEVFTFLEKNQLSHREFAKLAGTSPMTLYRAGKGEFDLKIKTVQKIERAMAKYLDSLT